MHYVWYQRLQKILIGGWLRYSHLESESSDLNHFTIVRDSPTTIEGPESSYIVLKMHAVVVDSLIQVCQMIYMILASFLS